MSQAGDMLKISARVRIDDHASAIIDAIIKTVREAVLIEIREQVQDALRPEIDRILGRMQESVSEIELHVRGVAARAVESREASG